MRIDEICADRHDVAEDETGATMHDIWGIPVPVHDGGILVQQIVMNIAPKSDALGLYCCVWAPDEQVQAPGVVVRNIIRHHCGYGCYAAGIALK